MTDDKAPDGSRSDNPEVMEIYKIAVEMADRVSARRVAANAFFLTVNTTLVAVVGLRAQSDVSSLLPIAVCVSGIAVAVCWWLLLRNYRRLNEAKFVVINKIEANYLPLTPFCDEWAILAEKDKVKGRMKRVKAGMRQLGNVERFVPFVFGMLYLVLMIERLMQ